MRQQISQDPNMLVMLKIPQKRPTSRTPSPKLQAVKKSIFADANQTITSLIEHVFQTNDDALEICPASLLNVVADFAQIDCVRRKREQIAARGRK